MCGIVAVIARPTSRKAPSADAVVADLAGIEAKLGDLHVQLTAGRPVDAGLATAAGRLESVEATLRGAPGLACLLAGPGLAVVERVAAAAEPIGRAIDRIETDLDRGQLGLAAVRLEAVNAALVRLRDAWWMLGRDRLRAAKDVTALRATADLQPAGAGTQPGAPLTPARLQSWWAINVALTSLDRLEVRGRDSAGVHVLVVDHGLDLSAAETWRRAEGRTTDLTFPSTAVRTPAGQLSFVFKAAAEIGELGDNVRSLRTAIGADPLLARALASPSARCVVLAHTRWASVGLVSEANAHPLNSDEVGGVDGPYVTATLNGDVDNHLELRLSEGLSLPTAITTDAKVIPALVARRLAGGAAMEDAFRTTVSRFDGSVAIAASSASTPDELHLALRGSGQSLNIGLAEDAFVVASEAYGLVEETSAYVRMDGESTGGQVVVLDRAGAGTLAGLTRVRYDGGALPVSERDVTTAEITTRDIDRRGFSHFLIKEVSEAPASFRKTIRERSSPETVTV